MIEQALCYRSRNFSLPNFYNFYKYFSESFIFFFVLFFSQIYVSYVFFLRFCAGNWRGAGQKLIHLRMPNG